MGLLDSILGKKRPQSALADTKAAAASTATAAPSAVAPKASPAVIQSSPSSALGAQSPQVDDAALVAPVQPPSKLGFFGGLKENLKQKLKGEVDGYVSEKAEEARVMAEQFRAETLAQVKTHAFELLDITEKRIDKKLGEIERMLDERLQQELRMRLRAMIWTLAFVLLMAIVSIIYVWAKHTAGLDNAGTTKQSGARP